MHLHQPLSIAVLFCSVFSVLASWGDILYSYRNCLYDCAESCYVKGYPRDLPMNLRLFGWTCGDECKYQCMHKVTDDDVFYERPIKQFHGKWPFVRLFGIQEPASAIFSILNGVGHLVGWSQYRAVVPPYFKMYGIWRGYMLVNINAWLWSTVFHIRDLNWTEKMDYFSATSLVLCSIYCLFLRVLAGPDRKWANRIFGSILLAMFSCHVIYLGFIKFDYGYNIKANVTIGIINLLGWLSWCIKNFRKQPYLWKCAIICVSLFCLVGLEVFDFPPIWWTFDAHSLWHLGTVPFCYFWYSFIIDDAKYQLDEEKKAKVA